MLLEQIVVNYEVIGPQTQIGKYSLCGVIVRVEYFMDDIEDWGFAERPIYNFVNKYSRHEYSRFKIYLNDGRFDGQLLRRRPMGYYKRVHIPSGKLPLVERLVFGHGGEIFYTADHYRTFVQVHTEK